MFTRIQDLSDGSSVPKSLYLNDIDLYFQPTLVVLVPMWYHLSAMISKIARTKFLIRRFELGGACVSLRFFQNTFFFEELHKRIA